MAFDFWKKGSWQPSFFFLWAVQACILLPTLLETKADEALLPPKIIRVPSIELTPQEIETFAAQGNRFIEVDLRIQLEGKAQLRTCDYSVTLCEKISIALLNAEFLPAHKGEKAIVSEVTVRLSIQNSESNTTKKIEEKDHSNLTSPAYSFGATAQVKKQPQGITAKILKVRDLPMAFGDPLRVVETFPGVTPVISGLPYFFVRGAPPSGTLFVYDDINVPSLYHLAIGPSVIHPAMMGSIKMYAGVAPARYGRFIGGIITSEGPEIPEEPQSLASEVELRLIDVGGYIRVPIGKGSFSASARFGYPGPLIRLVSSDVNLFYGDYQVRLDLPLGSSHRFQVIGLGAFDEFDDKKTSDVQLHFHRFELRLLREKGNFQYGLGFNFGFEESRNQQKNDDNGFSLDEIRIDAFRLSPRFWAEYKKTWVRLRIGGETIATIGKLRTYQPADTINPNPNTKLLQSVAGRGITSFYTEADLDLHWLISLELGLRNDIWVTGSNVEGSFDPRFRLILHPHERIDFHAAVGTAHQPAVATIQIPGLSEVAVSDGLQRAVQFDAGFSFDLPWQVTAEVQGFYHRYYNLYFPDSFFGPTNLSFCDTNGGNCEQLEKSRNGSSYGAEFYFKAEPLDSVGGWLSYTLAWSKLDPYKKIPSLNYTPSFDVRHVLNFVFRWNIVAGLNFGGRFHYRSGSPRGFFYTNFQNQIDRYQQRLPHFIRADAQLAYAWTRGWGNIRVAIEWFNLGLTKEPVGLDCNNQLIEPREPCPVEMAPAIFIPNISLRGNF